MIEVSQHMRQRTGTYDQYRCTGTCDNWIRIHIGGYRMEHFEAGLTMRPDPREGNPVTVLSVSEMPRDFRPIKIRPDVGVPRSASRDFPPDSGPRITRTCRSRISCDCYRRCFPIIHWLETAQLWPRTSEWDASLRRAASATVRGRLINRPSPIRAGSPID